MTNKEAILVLKSTSVNLGRRSGKTAYAEALEMAIAALQAQDKLQDIEYMCRLSGGADYFNAFKVITEKVKNTTTFLDNLNDGVKNANANSTNEIKSRVKGLTACRVQEDQASYRQVTGKLDTVSRTDAVEMIESTTWHDPRDTDVAHEVIGMLPSVQPLVIHCTDCEDWLERQSISGFTISEMPSAQPEQDREFLKLTVRNSNGRPYYSIIYLELDDNGVGHDFEGYSSYSLDVISDYLKKYFMPSVQPENCDTCKHGYFGDEQCNSCRVRFTSHYERRTDD